MTETSTFGIAQLREPLPYAVSDGENQRDFCGRTGSLILKARIEAYWKDRGYKVEIHFNSAGFHPAIRAARYDVRSDMKNGLPVKRTDDTKRYSVVLVSPYG